MDAPSAAPPTIIDAHCHIATTEHTPRSFIDGAIANMVTALVAQGVRASPKMIASMYLQKLQDPLCDELAADMAEAGIAKSVLLVPDFTYALKDTPLTIEESFLKHREVLLRHPGKFEVFGGVDPRWGADGIALFERSLKEFGFRGLKVYPPCGFSPSHPDLFPYYELCAHYRVPVLLHIGPTSPALSFETTNPFMLDEAARRFPTVNFILAHGSVSFTEECAMMCSHRPNVYLDISAFQSTLRADGSGKVVKTAVSRGINHKVIFGTDWPVFRLQGNQQSFVATVTREDGPLADLTPLERELVLHKNIERLLANARTAVPERATA
ncbi:amidohydrolase [Pyxidicoccus fallax]|uniref:Amidohydrolase n=1 Tax=Pyxidicoccus fallax TaxID=394095 RepID=A0A848LL02_9BACT|nr:amidohydrolase family protein [Pyxidicoccus fallax]NMO18465.1 amidohydrolase [Pyxidicoccus fallax]NPC81676.1 amidohydrolase [Pyxidicoccus fallax]